MKYMGSWFLFGSLRFMQNTRSLRWSILADFLLCQKKPYDAGIGVHKASTELKNERREFFNLSLFLIPLHAHPPISNWSIYNAVYKYAAHKYSQYTAHKDSKWAMHKYPKYATYKYFTYAMDTGV